MPEFRIEKTVRTLTMEFPSRMEFIDAAMKNTSDFVMLHNKSIDTFGLKLVLSETITNAVVHGNQEDENRPVHLHLILTPDEITIRIKDRGRGFAWQEFISGDMDDLNRTSGRGFALIAAYGYTVTFNKKGNTVCIFKKLDDVSRPSSEPTD
jgi:serine/threonine-protein kinase RsbW